MFEIATNIPVTKPFVHQACYEDIFILGEEKKSPQTVANTLWPQEEHTAHL